MDIVLLKKKRRDNKIKSNKLIAQPTKNTLLVLAAIVAAMNLCAETLSRGVATAAFTPELPAYLNSAFPIDKRVEDLLSRMTLEEKIGQLNCPCHGMMANEFSEKIDACRKFAEGKLVPNIGPAGGFWAPNILFGEGPRRQAEFLNELQKIAVEKTRLKVPLLFFEEGTHGLLSPGATVFP